MNTTISASKIMIDIHRRHGAGFMQQTLFSQKVADLVNIMRVRGISGVDLVYKEGSHGVSKRGADADCMDITISASKTMIDIHRRYGAGFMKQNFI